MDPTTPYHKGRGAQQNTPNRYHKTYYEQDPWENADELPVAPSTQLFYENPQKIISVNKSPDIPFDYSINPYQGCEHGCIYCYARPSHEYWGFSAGWDFESKIVVKKAAPQLLAKQLSAKNWQVAPVMLSGNTDPYQPLERQMKITRELLKVFAQFGNPVGIITKNSLVLRDLDILSDLAVEGLVHVMISLTTLDECLRQVMEPRTATGAKRLETIEQLTAAGVPVGVMTAPVIPSLNDHELPELVKQAAAHGALTAGYTVVRLNGALAELFKDWLYKNFPDRADKVWKQIAELHDGNVGDQRFGTRMKGEGVMAQSIRQLFMLAKGKYMKDRQLPAFDLNRFRKNGTLRLF
ncbi:PA0069 family radical SAM protein [Rapidithrix thailandica]|uniref:PA0069 family radical SAM protein n=1 Tax=Rapidithrix thailandica TaxID=413964 RepID=A0AAW9S469_9BACT